MKTQPSRTVTRALAILGILAGVLWIAWPSELEAPLAPAAPVEVPTEHVPPPQSASSTQRSALSFGDSERDLALSGRLRVRTIALATGQAISEATVTLIEGRHRMLAVNDRRLLLSMKTDAEGTANLLHPELASAGGLGVIAQAKGYVSTYAAVESSTRGELTLTLADERRATVSVREIDGKPVAGVRIELSASSFASTHSEPTESIPATDAPDAIHSSYTDDSGTARFNGLGAGWYSIRDEHSLAARGFLIVQANATVDLRSGDGSAEVIVAPMLGVSFRVVGDRLLSSRTHFPQGKLTIVASSQAFLGERRAKEILQERFPDTLTIIMVPRKEPVDEGTIRVPMTFARTGFELVELTLRRLPLAELVTIDRTNEPAEGALTPTRVEIEDASGRHFLAQHVSMQRTIGGQTGGDWYFDAPLDGFELPSGSYTVRSHDPGLRGSVSDAVVELQGSALQTIRLKCAESIRPCTIEIRLGSEAGPDFYELDLWLHGRNLHWSALKPRIESYFPIGFYEGQLEVFGHGKPQFSFAIEDDVERTRKQLVLEVAEGQVCVR